MTGALTLTGQLRLVGAVLVLLGLAHLAMPRALAWRPEFRTLRPLTRQIMYTHTQFIGLTCVLLGLAPLMLTADLLAPGRMPAAVLAAECVFWGARWCVQFVSFPPTLWWHSARYRAGYAALTLLWTWVVVVFAAALAARG
ncbi:hypothetical protein GCM10023322_12350 [Rugosimonospora acidiphila]|uniref:Uncharacterized protein n=1 Tax=Rugosimonospora acidiphila TaxID=556531 RepID=A0ABP9RN75_9ACTN